MSKSKDLSLYPTKAGVYLMKDATGRVLYIGKAKNLRARLRQYFNDSDERETIPYLLKELEDIDIITVLSEKEALILENNLIKKHTPKYNLLLKDDKTFIHLALTEHTFPMLKLLRSKKKPKNVKYLFGPYTSAKAARRSYDLILELFPLRQCSDAELANRKRPCLLYDIKKCAAPCVQKCSEKDYKELVTNTKNLLLGKNQDLLKDLKAKMEKASEDLHFEKAQSYLEMIQYVEHVLLEQHVDLKDTLDRDVVGFFRQADSVVIILLLFREGKLLSSEPYQFHQILSEKEEIVESFLLQHYQKKPLPKEILLPFPLPKASVIEEILQERLHQKMHLLFPKQGEKKKLLQMAEENAKALFEKEKKNRIDHEKLLLEMQEKLHLTRYPRVIECFDTSNISGNDSVAALVCFENGEKNTNRQRYFTIKGTEKSDDYTAMKEAIYRHFSKQKEENTFPDLLMVDGGKGQLNLALKIFEELNIANVDVIGLAKEESLHTKSLTQEKIFLPFEKEPIILPRYSPILFFLQKMRDEAHRVAIGFHRKRRQKRTITSELDEIKGIGEKKRKALLTHFKSISRIKEASVKELEACSFLNKKDVQTLWNYFHS